MRVHLCVVYCGTCWRIDGGSSCSTSQSTPTSAFEFFPAPCHMWCVHACICAHLGECMCVFTHTCRARWSTWCVRAFKCVCLGGCMLGCLGGWVHACERCVLEHVCLCTAGAKCKLQLSLLASMSCRHARAATSLGRTDAFPTLNMPAGRSVHAETFKLYQLRRDI